MKRDDLGTSAELTLLAELQQLYAEYAHALDAGEFGRWPDFFTDDAVYLLQSRENFDRGLPLATLRFESKAMLRDRVVGVSDTLVHTPYYQTHVVGAPRLTAVDEAGIASEASFIVTRTRRDALPEILCVGRYRDRLVRVDGALRFARRHVVFDNDLIANSIIYPI
jgi:salicylate 5-hydroxylase small subunit